MKLIERNILIKEKRKGYINLYPIGDAHIGKINCAEKQLRRLVSQIEKDEHALWIGGGDLIDAIKPQDAKRFDPRALPQWLLTGRMEDIRSRLSNIARAEIRRAVDIFSPIKDKCIGLICGNHEDAACKHYNHDVQTELCEALNAPDLTDCCFMRLTFRDKPKPSDLVQTITLFVTHGHGGGRTAGSEPTKLDRLAKDKDVDILLAGHSHQFCILPPIPVISISKDGAPVLIDRVKRAINWGCWVKSIEEGPATYESRALFPYKSLSGVCIRITPFFQGMRNHKTPIIDVLDFLPEGNHFTETRCRGE